VSPDLLPIVIVYDDADTLAFGVAYLSEDAYESPESVLRFEGASIEPATRAEFESFRRSVANLVSRESYHARAGDDVLKRMNLARAPRPFGHNCQGYTRYRIPDEVRPFVRQHWPRERPTYWRPNSLEVEQEFHGLVRGRAAQPDRPDEPPVSGRSFFATGEGAADRGMPTRAGGGVIGPARGHLFPPSFYPTSHDLRSDKWPVDYRERVDELAKRDSFALAAVDFRAGAMRGFGYCYAITGFFGEDGKEFYRKVTANRVDGQPVVSNRRAGDTQFLFFERDEYVFFFFQLYLESTRGDV